MWNKEIQAISPSKCYKMGYNLSFDFTSKICKLPILKWWCLEQNNSHSKRDSAFRVILQSSCRSPVNRPAGASPLLHSPQRGFLIIFDWEVKLGWNWSWPYCSEYYCLVAGFFWVPIILAFRTHVEGPTLPPQLGMGKCRYWYQADTSLNSKYQYFEYLEYIRYKQVSDVEWAVYLLQKSNWITFK